MMRRNRIRTVLTLAVVAVAVLGLTPSANARLVLEESFAYEILDPSGVDTQTPLDTLDGGTGFDGAWTATQSHGRLLRVGLLVFANGDPLTFNDDRGLHFTDINGNELPVAGAAVSRYGAAGRTQADRLLSAESQAALTQDNTTIWFSALAGGASNNTNSFFLFGTDPLIHTNIGQIAAPGQGFGFNISGPINALAFNSTIDNVQVEGTYTPTLQQGGNHYDTSLLVGKINWKPNGTPDEFFLFNVTDMSQQPDEADAIASISNLDFDQSGFDTITYADGAWGVIDEIRFGTNFVNVMGVLNSNIAFSPTPAQAQVDVLRDSTLSWIPGEFAATHNLYVGEDFDDVNDATVPTIAGLDVNSFDPGCLEFGKTLFWRVDEVNGTPDQTVFKGDVWSFTAEPYSIPIAGSEIIATASSSSNEFSLPQKTLDGSGLGEDDTHAIQTETMWFTAMGDAEPWIQYEFEGVKKLDIMTVWNSNSSAEGFIGYGVKGVLIEYSKDGETWTVFEDVNEFSRASGSPIYNQYDEINLGGVAAKMVRLNIQSNFGGFMQSYSLSEVQFSMIPTAARTPEPESGSVDILPDAVLSWRAGRQAAQSTVSLSTDANEVAEGLAGFATSNTNSINLNLFDIKMGQTYYWRVDEVNEAEAVFVWPGPVWSFSTVDTLMVEDFESYGNDSPNRPFQVWLDGYGYSVDEFFPAGYNGNGTGAGVGHDIWSVASDHYNGNIMETVDTMAGRGQSMPLYFNNSDNVASETQRAFAVPQDWTAGGATTLSVAFRGTVGNTGTLYVKINNTKVSFDGNASSMSRPIWVLWPIDLAATGVNLSHVTKMSIGVDGSGASGMVLIDDILLHPEPFSLPTSFDITTPGDVVQGVPNDDDWPAAETPDLAFDDNTATKYLHFKGGSMATGLQVTPMVGATVVTGLTLTTANDGPARDPITFELSGSNTSIDGPYILIAAGDVVDFSGETEWPRFTQNETAIEFENAVAYTYYQIVFPTVRGADEALMQVSEVELIGTVQ